MFNFIRKNNENSNNCYEIDNKSRVIIEKYMKKNSLRDITLFELLDKLGFKSNNKLYLRLEQDGVKLKIYYSYDKNNFNRDDYVSFNYVLERYIYVDSKNNHRSYFIKWEYPTGKFYLFNEMFSKKRVIDDVEYLITVYKGELKISIDDNVHSGIFLKINYSQIDEDKIIKIIDNYCEEYIYNIKISSNIDDVFEKFRNLLVDYAIRFKDFSVTYSNDKYFNSGYWIIDYKDECNNKLEYNNSSGIVYNRTMFKLDLNNIEILLRKNLNSIKIVFKNGDYGIEIEYLSEEILLNEIELINYLKEIKFPVKIEDICLGISKISFGDLDKYLEFSLKIYHNNIRSHTLSLKEGKLDYFQTVLDDKRITINHDLVFSYKKGNEKNGYAVYMNGDVVTRYDEVNENGILNSDNSNRLMYMAINEAKGEKIRVKKIVDKLMY